MGARVYSVTQMNRYIRQLFAGDGILMSCAVSGEVSNLKYHSSGHIYFSLKDRTASLSCVMFAASRKGLAFAMKDGDKVVVRGSVDVFERDGRYQLYAKKIELEGAGALYEQFLALKKELEECGYFDPAFKRPVPEYAARVGIVTAPGGAAIRDIQNIAARRNPYVQLVLAPALVQGEGAKESIVRGIGLLDGRVDVIIVGRGGGSYEDLWAFNERMVADAINECGTPVISAVGHETDFTIADFVADMRAPTPSAAAELAVFDYRLFTERLERGRAALHQHAAHRMALAVQRLRLDEARLEAASPRVRFDNAERRLHELGLRAGEAVWDRITAAEDRLTALREKLAPVPGERLRLAREQCQGYRARLDNDMKAGEDRCRGQFLILVERFRGLNPLGRLEQGYSFTADGEGRAVLSISGTAPGALLHTWVSDGEIVSEVRSVSRVDYPGQLSSGDGTREAGNGWPYRDGGSTDAGRTE